MMLKRGELRRLLHGFGVAMMLAGLGLSGLLIADMLFKFGGSSGGTNDASLKITAMMALGGLLYLAASMDRRLERLERKTDGTR